MFAAVEKLSTAMATQNTNDCGNCDTRDPVDGDRAYAARRLTKSRRANTFLSNEPQLIETHRVKWNIIVSEPNSLSLIISLLLLHILQPMANDRRTQDSIFTSQ